MTKITNDQFIEARSIIKQAPSIEGMTLSQLKAKETILLWRIQAAKKDPRDDFAAEDAYSAKRLLPIVRKLIKAAA